MSNIGLGGADMLERFVKKKDKNYLIAGKRGGRSSSCAWIPNQGQHWDCRVNTITEMGGQRGSPPNQDLNVGMINNHPIFIRTAYILVLVHEKIVSIADNTSRTQK